MIILNIILVLLGMAIPFGTSIFWSKAAKILGGRFENMSFGHTILAGNTAFNLVKSLYHHRTKFNILVAVIVTIIEFLALVQF